MGRLAAIGKPLMLFLVCSCIASFGGLPSLEELQGRGILGGIVSSDLLVGSRGDGNGCPAGFPLSAPVPLWLHASRRQIWVDRPGDRCDLDCNCTQQLITIIIRKDIFFLCCSCR